VIAWRLRHHVSLPSTSDLCIGLANQGEPEGLAILADRQTQGRGSRGRLWTSPPGALCLSLLVRPRDPARDAGHWALLAALALYDALVPLAPAELSLKWPNDLLRNGQKLGGILLDAATNAHGLDWLVIGIGANLGTAPPGAAALPANPATTAPAILAGITAWYRRRLLEGWSAIRTAWLARAHPVGTPVRVRAGGTDVAGAFDGLAEDGGLLLRAAGRVRSFPTGEILLAEHTVASAR